MVERHRRLYFRTHPAATVKFRSKKALSEGCEACLKESDDRETMLFRKVPDPHGTAAERCQHESEALMPRPPASCKDGSDFTCELCSMSLHNETGTNRSLWVNHINRDLELYVCLVDQCDEPNFLCWTMAQWLRHMKTHFDEWVCCFCPQNPRKVHSGKRLEKHFTTSHPDRVSTRSLPEALRHCYRSKEVSITFKECPFCDELPADMAMHIRRHLCYLAIVSTPALHDATAPKQDGDRDSAASRKGFAAKSSHAEQEPVDESLPNDGSGGDVLRDWSPFKSTVDLRLDGNDEGTPFEWLDSGKGPGQTDQWAFMRRSPTQHDEWRECLEERKVEKHRKRFACCPRRLGRLNWGRKNS
ncbi:Zinc finger, C2H2-like protein [Cordyceps fumosorosea ARSEF 2679]|uniref:Zinc finger, C2H2-like protein n=1 Tax=Cordyceps fumosorosea (strain ARSEF 2679) TaxID=1081104 RepID=A0A167NN60_CORFA|nr:Zinc finger, C2H2-like protein [Cordyceps fumosorosea ARSEF 2679]OAA55742.1 Zinc finger, C2H2-like protein [Cordyceps fumosorosea ARSEF 2679]